MAMIPLIGATTDEVDVQVPFETNGYDSVTLVASGLAGSEAINIYVSAGTDWAVYGDGSAALTLTEMLSSLSLPPGPRYGVNKPVTAGPAAVSVWLGVGGVV